MGSTYGPVESVSAARANRGPNQWCGVHRLVGPDHIGRSDDRSPCVRFHDEERRQRTNFPSGTLIDDSPVGWTREGVVVVVRTLIGCVWLMATTRKSAKLSVIVDVAG